MNIVKWVAIIVIIINDNRIILNYWVDADVYSIAVSMF